MPLDDSAAKRAGGWARSHAPSAYGGSYLTASRTGASALAGARGRVFLVLLDTLPAGGRAALLVDGKTVRIVSTAARTPRWGVPITFATRRNGRHTVGVRVVSGPIRFDGIGVTA